MPSIFIVIAAFFVMYIIVYIRQIRRNKDDETNSVEEFHSEYQKYQDKASEKYKNSRKNNYTYKYVTKYNSSEDYREK